MVPKGTFELALAGVIIMIGFIDPEIALVVSIVSLISVGTYAILREPQEPPRDFREVMHKRAEEKNMEEILDLVGRRGAVTTDEVEDKLHLSGNEVEEYMDELKDDGKIEELGTTPLTGVYRLK